MISTQSDIFSQNLDFDTFRQEEDIPLLPLPFESIFSGDMEKDESTLYTEPETQAFAVSEADAPELFFEDCEKEEL